jgi:hypothetical protein
LRSSSIDSPNIDFAIQKKSQCDSYIRCFEKKVKRKMHQPASFSPPPPGPAGQKT